MASDNKNDDPLFGNKVAGAILAALLLVFGLPQLTAAIFGGGHHGGHSEELHLAYGGDIVLETKSDTGEPEPVVDLGTLLAAASAEGGARRAGLCASCHTFEKGGRNGTGPNLWGIVGRNVASADGFTGYSAALAEFGGVWTYERLDCYLKSSQECVPGTGMQQAFRRDNQRADILAYLSTLSDDPVPFPAPAIDDVMEDAAMTGDDLGEDHTEDHGGNSGHH